MPGIATLWPLYQQVEFMHQVGTHQVQGETVPDIPVSFRLFPVPFGRQGRNQFLSFHPFLLPCLPVHREYKRYEVASSLKSSLKIFALFLPLVLKQDFVWVSPIIGYCFCVNNINVEDTHTTRVPEAKHSLIPTEVRSNLTFL